MTYFESLNVRFDGNDSVLLIDLVSCLHLNELKTFFFGNPQ